MTNPIFASGSPLRKRFSWFLAGAVLSTGLASSSPAPQSATRYTLASDQQFSGGGRQLLSISPDGAQFVYVANNSLYIKALAEKEARLVAGTTGQGNVTNPVFSPDGKFIAYWSGQDQSLKRVAVSGGTPQVICQAANPYGMSWYADNEIVFGQGAGGIRRVSATGGTAETIVSVKTGEIAHGPQMLPGGNALLYTLASNTDNTVPQDLLNQLNNAQAANQITPQQMATLLASLNPGNLWDKARIVVTSLKSNETKTLLTGGSDARYSPTGHIVYANAAKLMAVRFDASRQEISGSPVALMDGVRNAGGTTGTSQFSFSSTGSLVYISTASELAQTQREMSLVDMNGKVTLRDMCRVRFLGRAFLRMANRWPTVMGAQCGSPISAAKHLRDGLPPSLVKLPSGRPMASVLSISPSLTIWRRFSGGVPMEQERRNDWWTGHAPRSHGRR